MCYNVLMADLKTNLRKFRYFLKYDFFTFDNVVVLVAVIFCLIWTWGSISAMSRNWTLAQELMNRQRERALLELEVETLELENDYYASDEYQDIAARKYQNKKSPGETMIYLPENTEEAKAKDAGEGEKSNENLATAAMSNFDQWMAFLFGISFNKPAEE